MSEIENQEENDRKKEQDALLYCIGLLHDINRKLRESYGKKPYSVAMNIFDHELRVIDLVELLIKGLGEFIPKIDEARDFFKNKKYDISVN